MTVALEHLHLLGQSREPLVNVSTQVSTSGCETWWSLSRWKRYWVRVRKRTVWTDDGVRILNKRPVDTGVHCVGVLLACHLCWMWKHEQMYVINMFSTLTASVTRWFPAGGVHYLCVFTLQTPVCVLPLCLRCVCVCGLIMLWIFPGSACVSTSVPVLSLILSIFFHKKQMIIAHIECWIA